ncbi:unnamed protein product [Pedinophyceae sp. YPF-701]|nr:unnamed protein product [Pedinophyceae sp. YPF-701]
MRGRELAGHPCGAPAGAALRCKGAEHTCRIMAVPRVRTGPPLRFANRPNLGVRSERRARQAPRREHVACASYEFGSDEFWDKQESRRTMRAKRRPVKMPGDDDESPQDDDGSDAGGNGTGFFAWGRGNQQRGASKRAAPEDLLRNRALQDCEDSGCVLDLYLAEGDFFNQVNRATAVTRLASLVSTASGVRRSGRGASPPLAPSELVDLVVRITDEAVDARRRGDDMLGTREIINLLWSHARLHETLAERGACDDALARLRASAGAVAGLLAGLRKSELGSDRPQGYSNALWALAKLNLPADAPPDEKQRLLLLVRDLVRILSKPSKLRASSSHALTSALWAIAALNVDGRVAPDPLPLAQEIARDQTKLATCDARQAANAWWALATLNADLRGLGPDWADRMLDVWRRHSGQGARDVTPQAVSSQLWALGRLRWYPGEDVLAILVDAAVASRSAATLQALTNAMHGMAVLGHVPPPKQRDALFQEVQKRVTAQPEDLVVQPMCNLVWSAALMRHEDRSWWRFAARVVDAGALDAQDAGLAQVAQAAALSAEARRNLPASLLEAATRAWNAGVMRQRGGDGWAAGGARRLNTQHRVVFGQVRAVVRGLGFERDLVVEPEFLDGGGEGAAEGGVPLRSVDVAVIGVEGGALEGVKIAVEVDGEPHFMRNDMRRLVAATVLRDRDLQQRGWKLVRVPFVLDLCGLPGVFWGALPRGQGDEMMRGWLSTAIDEQLAEQQAAAGRATRR